MLPILMPVCDRPDYLRDVLNGLARVNRVNQVPAFSHHLIDDRF
jgi:hypothetical protein